MTGAQPSQYIKKLHVLCRGATLSMLELEDMLSQLQTPQLLVLKSRKGVGSGMRRTRAPSLGECRTCCLLGGSRWQRRTARWTARARPRCIAATSWSLCRCVTDTVGVYTPRMPYILLLVCEQERALVPLTLATLQPTLPQLVQVSVPLTVAVSH